ncbi:oligopeptide transporter [Dacryopinax primogenitus]|uniref:Oligopeptide transporter n=1 Tax=Dacryopinax primogenitus (strain DJM 731) TaxID=1858805 RepID=M5FSH2_DACPD|nr:oligopeptide transporter [Dacryopinax primogenitus]EJT98129.1 oligopeptide transporter [Dacryopinax primogenitus]
MARRPSASIADGEVEEIPLLANKSTTSFALKVGEAHTSITLVEDERSDYLHGARDGWEPYPTEEERSGPHRLRRVGRKISWPAYLIAFVELCERFSYTGTAAVFTNFLQRPLPPGSTSGANPAGTPGALGLGTNVAAAITQFNTLWVYVLPLVGAYIADTRLGRFKTVCWCVAIALFGHALMILPSLPSIIPHRSLALPIFICSLLIMGLGTGGFKSNISPLVAEQQRGPQRLTVERDEEGERVILDPSITTARIYMYFYLMINVGAALGQLCMTFAEKYVGFWAAFSLPTIMFCLCPIVLWWGSSFYTKSPPQGSNLLHTLRVLALAFRPLLTLSPTRFLRAWTDPDFWERAKPSYVAHFGRTGRVAWDEAFVEEVRKVASACAVFVWYPFYWISFNEMYNNMTSQAATLTTHGIPNDVINNINPIALLFLIPIFDKYLYPFLRRRGYNFSPLKRMFAGFISVGSAMIWAGILQCYIYTASPCGYRANDPNCEPAGISVWWQTGAYVLIAVSEIFASITGLEYAFTKAPKSMKSLIMALFLSTSAFASLLGECLNPLAGDPLLIWNYAVCAGMSLGAGAGFWWTFRALDAQEEKDELGGRKDLEDEDGENDDRDDAGGVDVHGEALTLQREGV